MVGLLLSWFFVCRIANKKADDTYPLYLVIPHHRST